MELKEVLAYYNIYEIPNIPFPFPQGVVIVGIIIKGNLPMDQYLSDILITIFIHFSLTSGLMYFQNPLKFLSPQWFFDLQGLIVSLDLGMFLDP